MPGIALRLVGGLLILAAAGGCGGVRKGGAMRCWADYNTLRAPAAFFQKIDRQPYTARRVKQLNWMYNPGGGQVLEQAVVFPPEHPAPAPPPTPLPPPGFFPELPERLPPPPGRNQELLAPPNWGTEQPRPEVIPPPIAADEPAHQPVWYRELDRPGAVPAWYREL